MDPSTEPAAEPRERAEAEPPEQPYELAHDELGYGRADLCTYELPEGTRQLSAQRVGPAVHVTDRPLGHPGETYLVQTDVTAVSELEALAADYAEQAKALGDCPMRASAIDATESSREREAVS